MLRSRRVSVLLAGLILCLGLAVMVRLDAEASTKKEYFDSLSVGISQIVDPTVEAVDQKAIEELTQISEANASQEEEESDLVMVNVQVAMNVRAEAAEESDKVGVLYKDCGGTILERSEGWTKLKSGNVTGWAKDEFLLFGEEAKDMAEDVGNWIVTLDTDAVRVRTDPSEEAETCGLLAYEDSVEFIDTVKDGWISVEFNDEVRYVNSDYVNVKFHIDEAESIEVIKAREREEEERRQKAEEAKRKANRGAVAADADELRLLGALIYCEAGNQSYDGMVGVGAVVMNRVKSGAYPNTIHSVIYASGQFTPAMTGKVAKVYEGNVPSACMQAAQAALNGETTVGGATHFKRAGKREGYVLGDHVFW